MVSTYRHFSDAEISQSSLSFSLLFNPSILRSTVDLGGGGGEGAVEAFSIKISKQAVNYEKRKSQKPIKKKIY